MYNNIVEYSYIMITYNDISGKGQKGDKRWMKWWEMED